MSLHKDVYWLLKDTAMTLKAEMRKKIEDYGITWPQFHALYHIPPGGIPANELARELHCNASNMTGLIDRMAENGWVYRERSPDDRRIWLIKLTPQGARLKATVLPNHQQNIRDRMTILSEQELTTLHKLLTKLKYGYSEEDQS